MDRQVLPARDVKVVVQNNDIHRCKPYAGGNEVPQTVNGVLVAGQWTAWANPPNPER